MKRINVRFEQDSSLDCIEVTVRASERDAGVEELLSRINGEETRQITVTDGDGAVRVIPSKDIYIVSVNGKTLTLLTENEKFTVRRSLQSIEEVLDGRRFIRVSRYELVNLSKVKHYDFTLRGTLRIEFDNGMEAWASRRCIPAIRRLLSGKE